jgi:small-conductance mechanosensitive channel
VNTRTFRIFLLLAALIASAVCCNAALAESDAAANAEAPLVIGSRTVHVFRAPLGAITPLERAAVAKQHIETALDQPGEGWTSVESTAQGVVVALDGVPMFTVVEGDARSSVNERPEALANEASRLLQRVWLEHREHLDPKRHLWAAGYSALILTALFLLLWLLSKTSHRLQDFITKRLEARIDQLLPNGVGAHFGDLLLTMAARAAVLMVWVVGLIAVFLAIAQVLARFALTRVLGEQMVESLQASVMLAVHAVATSLPGLFVAMLIFLLARLTTQLSRALFARIAAGRLRWGALDAHTAPVTGQLVSAAIWLFALAMAYPYLPGSQTEAFKGLSVLLGLMVSIGASGLIGQVASGLILVFTRALRVGEYVRIQDQEGTVIHLGLLVTRLRTGMGEEISLPNSLVNSQVTRNYSRDAGRGRCLIETTITIGYDAPWRQVHALLQSAAATVPSVCSKPEPYVVQTALNDFYVSYRLVAQIEVRADKPRARVLGELHAAIQDAFNRAGVQIMSPHYLGDPAQPKVVPEAHWNGAPPG